MNVAKKLTVLAVFAVLPLSVLAADQEVAKKPRLKSLGITQKYVSPVAKFAVPFVLGYFLFKYKGPILDYLHAKGLFDKPAREFAEELLGKVLTGVFAFELIKDNQMKPLRDWLSEVSDSGAEKVDEKIQAVIG